MERLFQKLFSKEQVKTRTYFLKKSGEKLQVDVYICLFEINGQKFIQTVARDILEFEKGDNENLDRGTKLRVLMSKKNINTFELAEMTGLSIATILNLRTGKITKPHIGIAKFVLDILEVELNYRTYGLTCNCRVSILDCFQGSGTEGSPTIKISYLF